MNYVSNKLYEFPCIYVSYVIDVFKISVNSYIWKICQFLSCLPSKNIWSNCSYM